MKSLHREKVLTKDGTSTFYIPELDEHYHSIHGAVQESKHVFMKMGWDEIQDSKFKIENSNNVAAILEVGFGTGLNAFLVACECAARSTNVNYTSLEAFPLVEEEWGSVNYAEDKDKELFSHLHLAEWNSEVAVSENFILHKINSKLDDYFPLNESFDLIFFDAFGPRVQPEMWTEEVFRKMFSCIKNNGILVTYCAKGQVRRNMIAAGFTVERAQGPPGKREMLRATKIQ